MENPELIRTFEDATDRNGKHTGGRVQSNCLRLNNWRVQVQRKAPILCRVFSFALKNNSAQVRMLRTQKLLGSIQDETAVPDLVRLLADP